MNGSQSDASSDIGQTRPPNLSSRKSVTPRDFEPARFSNLARRNLGTRPCQEGAHSAQIAQVTPFLPLLCSDMQAVLVWRSCCTTWLCFSQDVWMSTHLQEHSPSSGRDAWGDESRKKNHGSNTSTSRARHWCDVCSVSLATDVVLECTRYLAFRVLRSA